MSECNSRKKVARSQNELFGLPDEALITRKEVMEITTLSRSSVERMLKTDSFPAPIELAPRTFRWKIGLIREFIDNRAGAA